MAFGNATFANASAAVNDLLSSKQNAAGLRIKADGIRIQAQAGELKAVGNETEATNYDLASGLALDNAEFTRQSTAVKQVMADRQIYMALGGERAAIAGSGLTEGGSALDILRSSAQQGALQKQLLGQQGLIQEAGYREQATSFTNLAGYARYAAGEERSMAEKMGHIAAKTDDLARKTERDGRTMAIVHGISAIGTLFTGGGIPGMGGGGG